MKPRISLLTLGVSNLQRAVAFYREGLGFETPGIVGTEYEHGAVAFFDLENGLKLALWPRADLAHDSGLPEGKPSSTEFSLGHNVNSREESISSCRMRAKLVLESSNLPKKHSGEGMPATSLIPMVTFGKSRGTRSSWWQNPNRVLKS